MKIKPINAFLTALVVSTLGITAASADGIETIKERGKLIVGV